MNGNTPAQVLPFTHNFNKQKMLQNYIYIDFEMFMAPHSIKETNLWSDKWILHYDNVPSHTELSAKQENT
jgi:hypothetical protein